MAAEIKRDPDLEWLDHVPPVGLVVAPVLLKDLGLAPTRQTQVNSAQVAEHIGEDETKPGLTDPWSLVQDVLGWEAAYVAGCPGGPPLPDEVHVRLPEHATTLSPTWAVKELGAPDQSWQLLVRIEPTGVDPDVRGTLDGWEATAHQRFERLLRESGVYVGVLISEKNDSKDREDRFLPELRLVYAPKGETSGYVSFPLRDLRTVAGRPMLGGLKLLLDSFRLFADAGDRRLPALLRKSREAQAAVSTALAEQVLGALHELLRGLDAAAPDVIRELAQRQPGRLYEGLLTVLMRLVFVLYAEDRGLLPSRSDGRAQKIYETGYSLRGLYDKLTGDAALNPDTMDERRGGWGQLLALFRLIHKGHPSHFIQARGGKLFDPEQFPFLEGRTDLESAPRVLAVSDGCILRILEGLMTLTMKGGTRERLSYRTLDVEQIGSVYETVMGFTVETAGGRALAIRAGKNNRTPVFVDLEKLTIAKGKDRIKYLKEQADRGQLPMGVAKVVEAAKTATELAAALDPIVDERGSPKKHEIAAGMPMLQPTDERRRTGSHYTPRSLTGPIVRYALEPAFERLGPDAKPEQILDLKVCDPAMGSGAFLVEACRALAARLVEAWSRYPEKKPAIPPDEDEDLHARRLVAQRCLYGVDKNPLATDLAKLSLWLATLARDHEFTFLDHALKSGDSLVGLTQAQIAAVHWDTSKPGLPLFRQLVKERVAEAMKGRVEIQAAPDDTARAIQEQRHHSLEERLKDIRLMGDAVIAAFFAEDKPKAREKKRAEVESWLTGSLNAAWGKLVDIAAALQPPLTPFHWEIEFPEVFATENSGFSAIVGNPPFLGGARISEEFGRSHFNWLTERFAGCGHQCDLAGYFFRLAFALIRQTGSFGLLATKTLAEGDTRQGSLFQIVKSGGAIYRAITRYKWPGEASTIVNVVHIGKFTPQHNPVLNGRSVARISAYLREGNVDESPHKLNQNAFYSKGSLIYGQGFLFDDHDAKASPTSLMEEIVEDHPQLRSRIWPFIGGEDVNRDPRHLSRRFVIDLNDLVSEAALAQSGPLAEIVRDKVRPERMALGDNPNNRPLKSRWWAHQAHRPGLYARIRRLRRVLGIARVTPHVAFAFLPTDVVFAEKVILFEIDHNAPFAVLQSRVHETWVRSFTSTLGETLNYAPTDCYENFPFCKIKEPTSVLEVAGRSYHDHRASLMVTRDEGMTKIYNRFHDRAETSDDIQRLRELHAAMDREVLEAYGWRDLAARSEPTFLDETNEDDHPYQGRLFWPSDFRDEVLARLLALNAERHAEEVRQGAAPPRKGKAQEEEVEIRDEDLVREVG